MSATPAAVPKPYSPRIPQPLPEVTFETQSIALAAALAATQQLQYLGPRLHENGRDILFRFDDPLSKGDELARRFQHGIGFPLVNAKTLTEAHRFLTEDIRRVKGATDAQH